MLKTNSKKARENIRAYIVANFGAEGYENRPSESATFPEIARFILEQFRAEKYHFAQDFRYYGYNEARAFADWCAGLPSVIDTCYYYNRSAVADFGAILEETESEKNRYMETDAENLLTALIYRELTREGAKK